MSSPTRQRSLAVTIEADENDIAARTIAIARGLRPNARIGIYLDQKLLGTFLTDANGDADWSSPFPWPGHLPHLTGGSWNQVRSIPYPRRGVILSATGQWAEGSETLQARYLD